MKINDVPPSLWEKVLTEIKSVVPVHSVYWINAARQQPSSDKQSRSTDTSDLGGRYQLTLLLITYEKVYDRRSISEQIYLSSGLEVKAHLLLYTYEEIYEMLESGDNFLSRALKPKHCLYQESSLSVPKYMAHPAIYKNIKKGWLVRTSRATYFEANAEIVDVTRNEVARMAIIRQIIYHSSTSLLWVFWEYPATTSDIDLLLHLCKSFTDLPDMILPGGSDESQRTYEFIRDAVFNLQYNMDLILTRQDTEIALEKAKEFRVRAADLGKERLDQLREIHLSRAVVSMGLMDPGSGGNHLLSDSGLNGVSGLL